MNLVVIPERPLQGIVALPGDKSISHRAALFASLAEGVSRVENFLVAGVTQAMLDALERLGIEWDLQGTSLTVQGAGLSRIAAGKELQRELLRLDCGNSATTLRMLAGALTAMGIPAVLDGSAGLRRRPMRRIIDPLQQMGARIESADGCAPLILHPVPHPLRALTYSLPIASAQVKTCLLLAGLAADGPTCLYEPGPSRDHTERMLNAMGVSVRSQKDSKDGEIYYETRLTPPQDGRLGPIRMRVPGDFSSAAFLIVAALITPGSDITLTGVGLNPTRTGLLDVLMKMGAEIELWKQTAGGGEPSGDLRVKYSQLHGALVDGDLVVRMIDEFPAFAVAAASAYGTTVVRQAGELRHKESDRISSVCQELRKLGIRVEETPDGFSVQGGRPPEGGIVQSHGDHRLAMALTVLGLSARAPVIVKEAEIFRESYPEFVATLQQLGGHVSSETG